MPGFWLLWGEEKCIQCFGFGVKSEGKWQVGSHGQRWEDKIKTELKGSNLGTTWNVLIWLRVGKSVGLFWTWSHYLSRVDHERKIRSRRQRTDIGKYSFLNRTIQHWNQLVAEVLGTLTCKPITFKKMVRKMIIELN